MCRLVRSPRYLYSLLSAVVALFILTGCDTTKKNPIEKNDRKHENVYFDFSSARLFGNSLNIQMQRTRVIEHPEKFNFFDPHNSHTEYKTEDFNKLITLDHKNIDRKIDVSFAGELNDIIYADPDFSIALKNHLATVINKNSSKAHSYECERAFWGVDVVRLGTKLYFCGRLFSVDDEAVGRFPEKTKSELLSLANSDEVNQNSGPSMDTHSSPIFTVKRENNDLIFVLRTTKGPNAGRPQMSYFVFDPISFVFKGKRNLPFDQMSARFVLSKEISCADGLILVPVKESEKNIIYVCNSGRCRTFDAKVRGRSDVLLIDNEHSRAVVIKALGLTNSYPIYDLAFVNAFSGSEFLSYD
ncbi:hypothetical protein H8K35_10495 [Undibacterium sp. LX40W]|uniref:Lipoprotein n=1 Tax=Undibacterium nitidum TaxID=2762298 RepID=A0A923HRE8_9BURK|nr:MULTISPECIES: hypothetical protein [Undibacterium]MBC3881915.1 hypothetical protein [Undibacterium nitidum]MBC3892088.1 hypothetical protein [Undibacterium sp. LX40W]